MFVLNVRMVIMENDVILIVVLVVWIMCVCSIWECVNLVVNLGFME